MVNCQLLECGSVRVAPRNSNRIGE